MVRLVREVRGIIRFALAYTLMWAGVALTGTAGALALVAAAGLLLSLAKGGES
jgi:hypothetical protein